MREMCLSLHTRCYFGCGRYSVHHRVLGFFAGWIWWCRFLVWNTFRVNYDRCGIWHFHWSMDSHAIRYANLQWNVAFRFQFGIDADWNMETLAHHSTVCESNATVCLYRMCTVRRCLHTPLTHIRRPVISFIMYNFHWVSFLVLSLAIQREHIPTLAVDLCGFSDSWLSVVLLHFCSVPYDLYISHGS